MYWHVNVCELIGIDDKGRTIKFIVSLSPVFGRSAVLIRANGYFDAGELAYTDELTADIENNSARYLGTRIVHLIKDVERFEVIDRWTVGYDCNGQTFDPRGFVSYRQLVYLALDTNSVVYNK